MLTHLATAIYRILLAVYPRGFRRQFGAELVETFRFATASLQRARGVRAALAFAATSYADTLVTAMAEHREDRGRKTAAGARSTGDDAGLPALGTRSARDDAALPAAGSRRHEQFRFPRRDPGGPSRLLHRRRRVATLASELLGDLRFALRSLLQSPGFAAVAILSLALGIGGNAAMFSIVDGVALRGLPMPDAERLVHVWRENLAFEILRQPMSVPPSDLERWGARTRTLVDLQTYRPGRAHVTDGAEPEEVAVAETAAGFFDLLGLRMVDGRGYTREDIAAGAQVVVLDERLARRRFGEADAVGRSITIDGVPHVVIGIVDARYTYPESTEMWRPLDTRQPASGRPRNLGVLGKLAEGVRAADAEGELKSIMESLSRETGDDAGWSLWVQPLLHRVVGDAGDNLFLLLAAVGFVLLIACANVANLLLVRAAGRRREIAVRAALGAGRGRIVRQLLVESGTLALLGGAVGIVIAAWGLDSLLLLAPRELPRLQEVTMNGRVLAFSLVVTALASILFGVVPALKGARLVSAEALHGAADLSVRKGRVSLGDAFVVLQVALGMVLMVGAGLLINSFVRLINVDPGFDPTGVVRARIELPEYRYEDGSPVKLQFYRDLMERLGAAPSVEQVALGSNIPMSGSMMVADFEVEDRDVDRDEVPTGIFGGSGETLAAVDLQVVTPSYFPLLDVRILRGRGLTAADSSPSSSGALVGVVNDTMARILWPGEDALGKRLRLGAGSDGEAEPWITVVGVSADFKQGGLDADVRPQITLPMGHPGTEAASFPAMNLLLKGGAREVSIAALREALWAVDPDLPIPAIDTMEQLVAESIAQPRFLMAILGGFAAAALLLASLGIYGVMAFTVARRTFEIGVRKALGATASDVLRGVLRRAATLVAVGLAIGALTAFWLTRYLGGVLFAVAPTDRSTFAVVVCTFVAVALLASYLPARRAGRVDPMKTLRGL